MTIRLLALSLILFSISAVADYAWITPYRKLSAKAGVDIFRSSQNFADDAALDPLRIGGRDVQLADNVFWIEPEYGIAENWALGMRLNYIRSTVDPLTTGAPFLSGAGIGDAWASVKWTFRDMSPLLTMETSVKAPLGYSVPRAADEIVLGEGNLDLGVKIHSGHRSGSFMLGISPGVLFRFGGYASAGTLDVLLQLAFPRGYIRAVGALIYPFSETPHLDSSLTVHDAPGSGGSYARLNGSPFGITTGGKLGFQLFGNFSIEGGATFAVYGQRFPNFFNLTFNIVNVFDFEKPMRPKRLKEVPFDEDSADFYKDRL